MLRAITAVPMIIVLICLSPLVMAKASMPQNIDAQMRESWRAYCKSFITKDGRVVDPDEQYTTSEGQSYALLRAAYMDDRQTFEKVWMWTKQNLTRPDGKAFAWKWGKSLDGSYGILDQKSASDADEDIALALIVGHCRFHEGELLQEARRIIDDIWEVDVITVGGRPYLSPGSWGKDNLARPILNPSYFAPYEYRLFANLDTKHDWIGLVDTSYDVLNKSSDLSRLGLPPDWCELEPGTRKISLMHGTKSDYSYDAMRVPWRVCADWQWFKEPKAKDYLSRLYFFMDSWAQTRTICSAYSPQGLARSSYAPLCGFGCVLPMLARLAPDTAQEILMERIQTPYYHGLWHPRTDYYSQNWAWFGLALTFGKFGCPSIETLSVK